MYLSLDSKDIGFKKIHYKKMLQKSIDVFCK